MDNKLINATKKNSSNDASLLSESKLSSSQPQSKLLATIRNKQKMLFIIVIIICGLLCYAIFIHNGKKGENLQSQINPHSLQSMQPQINTSRTTINNPITQPTPTAIQTGHVILGTMKWKTTPQQITPQMPLSLLNAMKYQPTPYSNNPPDTSPQIQYYNVGTWTSGPYKGDQLIDVAVTLTTNFTPPHTSTQLLRVTVDGQKLIYFPNSSSTTLSDTPDEAINIVPKTTLLVDDSSLIPDLLSSYPVYNSALAPNNTNKPIQLSYNGKLESFTIESGDNTWNQSLLLQYTKLTSFFKGQIVYARTQSNSMPFSTVEDTPYVIQDVDHSLIDLYTVVANELPAQDISWKTKPLSPQGILNVAPPDYWYSSSFQNGCTQIPATHLVGNAGFIPDQLQQVGTVDGENLYTLNQSDTLYRALYSYLTPTIASITPAATMISYNDFINTYPVLIGKDAFGEYQIFYRLGYWDNAGGCGKPVIYLYPTKKAQVSIHFSPVVTLSKSTPSYNAGWKVFAYPDGSLINASDQKTYPYLYWEGVTNLEFPPITTGFVIRKEQVVTFLQKQLTYYGLNSSEKNDFLSYWAPRMQQTPYYLIHFYTTSDLENTIPEYINPMPDTVFRILMWFHPLTTSENITPQEKPTQFNRKGFTVVEWGGVEN